MLYNMYICGVCIYAVQTGGNMSGATVEWEQLESIKSFGGRMGLGRFNKVANFTLYNIE